MRGAIETRRVDPAVTAADGSSAPALAASLPRIVARAHEISASVACGVHGRRRAGPGETFWQFRPFASGEASTRIDWRRSARGDQLYVREREWEAAHDYYLWIDASPSMGFASSRAKEDKFGRALTLGLALANLLVRGGERVAALGLTAPVSARDIINRLVREMVAALTAPDEDASIRADLPPPSSLRPRARLLLISDFLVDPSVLSERLNAYAASGASGALLMIVDPCEETFPFAGETLFLDTDGGASFYAGDAQALRDDYEKLYGAHKSAIAAVAQRAGFHFLIHHTDRPASEAALALIMSLQGDEAKR